MRRTTSSPTDKNSRLEPSHPRPGLRPLWLLAVLLALTLGGATVFAALDRNGHSPSRPKRPLASNNPLRRACDLEHRYLVRIWRGTDQKRSGDLLLVPREPNFTGSFTITSHSGPWLYLQQVPLVLYGPDNIAASGAPLDEHANVTDIFPTVGELLDVELPPRGGEVLDEALARPSGDPPKLVVVVVWDGAGRGTLEQWPGRWPTLERMEREGTSYLAATVGSAPSTTPTIHSSIGTGAFPRSHGVTGNYVRAGVERVHRVFSRGAPSELELTTFGDEVDQIYGNAPKVGMLAWLDWHLGMLGHGAGIPGGDSDDVARVHYSDHLEVTGNQDLYSVPSYLARASDVHSRIDDLDGVDGKRDGRWLGHEIDMRGEKGRWSTMSNPAWAEIQADQVLTMLETERYGHDDVPDIFLTNFKMTDLAAHLWGVDSEEVGAALEGQDAALERILRFLDEQVRDYVVILTADHGATLSPKKTGAWPIQQSEVIEDINENFDVPKGSSLVQETALFDIYLDKEVMGEMGITANDIARFMNSYTMGDNWDKELPGGYQGRESEQLYSAVIPTNRLNAIMRCAFGSARPPDIDA
jgi:hypothetical protein